MHRNREKPKDRALRAAAMAALLLAVGFSLIGTVVWNCTGSVMRQELRDQVLEEAGLFQQIFEAEGTQGLISAIGMLERMQSADRRFASLFDSQGNRLAGNIDLTPDAVAVFRLKTITAGSGNDPFMAKGLRLADQSILIVGRSTEFITRTLRTLAGDLALSGAAAIAVSLLAGWVVSRETRRRLAHIETVLSRIGRGDTDARIKAEWSDGAIARIAALTDETLERLSVLIASSQNTVQSIAHDLRTPLNRANIKLQEALEADGIERANKILDAQEELAKLGAIFDTLLRISRIEGATGSQGFERFDLADLVPDLTEIVADDIELKGQHLSFDIPAGSTVFANPRMIRQLLVNLLSNAARHTPQGSTITVSVAFRDGRRVLTVSDDGPGIPEKDRDRALKPFARLDPSRTSEGAGLGLALANAIAVRHGSQLELDDAQPGLAVRVALPAEPVPT